MKDTVILIKDDVGSAASAESIVYKICVPLVAAAKDINLKQIIVVANRDTDDIEYQQYMYTLLADSSDVTFTVILLPKNTNKLTFAGLHNRAVEVMTKIESHPTNMHIISGALAINPDKTEAGTFATLIGRCINEIHDLLHILKRPVWFSTASDAANYAFNHYYTVADILNIDGKLPKINLPPCVMWSGNSNLDWIYMPAYTPNLNIDITLDMAYDYDFLSIKSLIAKSTSTPGYFVNLFPTIPAEVGTFYRLPAFDRDNQKYDFTEDKYKKNIDAFTENTHSPTANAKTVNDVVEYMRNVLGK